METLSAKEKRDLSFAPANRNGARVLKPEQIDLYNQRGYFHPITLFTGSKVANMRKYVDHLFELLKADGQTDSYALLGYHTRCPGLYDLATDSRILDVVEDIIGSNIICWTSHVFCKVAHDPKSVPFHQDASYWPLTPSRTVSVWLAIDDSDQENSCLQVIPGTHKKGHLKWSKAVGDVVLDQRIEKAEIYGAPALIELRAGQCSIHADLIAHGSNPNRSERRRCGYAIRYCPPSVRPLTPDWGLNAILCRGEDTTGHWTHNSRPEKDDVSPWRAYWAQKARDGLLKDGASQRGGAIGA
jgi:non-haem Fe2+, alpha-ketoglutarate-dependent halogenase